MNPILTFYYTTKQWYHGLDFLRPLRIAFVYSKQNFIFQQRIPFKSCVFLFILRLRIFTNLWVKIANFFVFFKYFKIFFFFQNKPLVHEVTALFAPQKKKQEKKSKSILVKNTSKNKYKKQSFSKKRLFCQLIFFEKTQK